MENRFARVFDMIDMIFSSVNSDFSSYLFDEKKISNKDECFKILFLALYDLLAGNHIITDYEAVANAMRNANYIFSQFTKPGKVNYNDVNKAIQNLYNILKPSFSYEVSKKDDEFVLEIDKRLTYSKIERQMTEFKIGISDFKSKSINKDTVKRIAKTLVAMANTNNAKEDGLLIIGIADNKEAYVDWYNAFKKQAVINNQHFVPGITSEAKKLFGNTDTYYRKLRNIIENEPISPKLKEYVLETFEPFDYHGVEIMVFKSKNMEEISYYNGIKYVRNSSENITV